MFKLEIGDKVAKDLRKTPERDRQRILQRIESLPSNPFPQGVKKLVNQPGYRIRIGSYRILYEVDESQKVIRIYRAGHRREIHR